MQKLAQEEMQGCQDSIKVIQQEVKYAWVRLKLFQNRTPWVKGDFKFQLPVD